MKTVSDWSVCVIIEPAIGGIFARDTEQQRRV